MKRIQCPMFLILRIVILLSVVICFAGCAPLWFAGGAVAGVAIAKDAQDGKIIDSKKQK